LLIYKSSWQDRIPVVLLFGIATSIEIFQDRLPRAALLAIEATQFDVVQSDELLERMFNATITADEDEALIRIGPSLASTILQRQRQNIQSPQDFINALQVCHSQSLYLLTG
jgi:origin recognition complex subunit 3